MINSLVKEMSEHPRDNILLCGDFNFPAIDWNSWTSPEDDQ
jgi:hypothetical protein